LNRDGKPSRGEDAGEAETKSDVVVLQRLDCATLEAGNRCKAVIDAWKKEGGILEVVGEPTVATMSGRPASWHVGGAFPILVPAGGGAVATKLQPYGTQLDVMSLLLEDGRVRLELHPRLSEIDEARTVTVNGVTVPGLRVRDIDAGVELKPGQIFAVSGHRQLEALKNKRGWSLRREDALQEIELLVLAKVELVDAMVPGEGGDVGSGHDETPHAD
jgi:pilus assembly protein CpaC